MATDEKLTRQSIRDSAKEKNTFIRIPLTEKSEKKGNQFDYQKASETTIARKV